MREGEKAQRGRQVGCVAVLIYVGDQCGEAEFALFGDLFQRCPEFRFERDAGAVAGQRE